jgi:phosphatidylinositol alpha-1,6-mannosyltransferase
LFGDRIVVQSEWTRRQLEQHLPGSELSVILPAAPEIPRPSEAAKDALREQLSIPRGAPVVVYPGDLEFSQGSQYFAGLVEALGSERPDAVFVYACRAKTAAAAGVARALEARLSSRNVRFAGELPSLLPLLDLATLVAFPTDSAFGKVDIPIALLEAMRLGVPVLSFDFGPLVELEGTVQVPLLDAGALLEAARSLLDGSAERERVAQAQTAFLNHRLDPRQSADAYEHIYRQTLNLD